MFTVSALIRYSLQSQYTVRKYACSLVLCQHRGRAHCYAGQCYFRVTGVKNPQLVSPIFHHFRRYSKVVDSSTDGRTATIVWDNGQTSRFHSKWLRFNCRCNICVNSETNMGRIEVEKLPMKMTLKDIILEGDTFKVTWNEDSHQGIIKAAFLKEYCYSEEKLNKTRKEIQPQFYTNDEIPKVSWEEAEKSEELLYRWLKNIGDQGLCLLTDVPTNKESFLKVLRTIGYPTGTMYGETFEVLTMKNATNLAYLPLKLHFHMDLLFYSSSPGLQFLHCLCFDESVTGGKTLFVDMFHIVDEFRKMHPYEFKTLCKVPAMFWRIHDKRDDPVNMVVRKPIIKTNNVGEVISVCWHPHIMGPPLVNETNVEDFYNAVQVLAQMVEGFPYVKRIRLKEGEMICFNNKRIAHGRTAYDSGCNGTRHLLGGYINIDDFRSKLKVLAKRHDPDYIIPRIGNSDWL